MGADISRIERERDEARREVDRFRREADEARNALETQRREHERAEIERCMREVEERLLRGIPPEIRPTVEDMQRFRAEHHYQRGALNIAVTGESGVGKSTLLNALRGLYDDEEGAAAVGVNETTAVIQGYADPKHLNVKWFDIPGANTVNVRGWLYFTTQHLYIFDAIVVLFSDRFTETVGTILQNARQCGIPAYLVRTKADQLVHNLKRMNRKLNREDAVRLLVEMTEETVYQNLVKLNLPRQPVYTVSADGMCQWLREGDDCNVIDDKKAYETIFQESKGRVNKQDGQARESGDEPFVEI